jgi:hypothetical protein
VPTDKRISPPYPSGPGSSAFPLTTFPSSVVSYATMLGTTAQLVALACHFNGRARMLHPVPFFPSNSTCKFCERVDFVRQSGAGPAPGSGWVMAAQTPDEWLSREPRPGRRAVLLYGQINDGRISDRMSAGFVGGGGRWKLFLTEQGRSDVWEAHWNLGDSKARDKRIWSVRYHMVAENLTLELPTTSAGAKFKLGHYPNGRVHSFVAGHKIQ